MANEEAVRYARLIEYLNVCVENGKGINWREKRNEYLTLPPLLLSCFSVVYFILFYFF